MSKYQFYVEIKVRGYIEVETDNPEEYARELEDMGIAADDLTCQDDEFEIIDWSEVAPQPTEPSKKGA